MKTTQNNNAYFIQNRFRMAKKRQWSEEQMALAIEAVSSGNTTQYEASKLYNIPRQTLHDQVYGKVTK